MGNCTAGRFPAEVGLRKKCKIQDATLISLMTFLSSNDSDFIAGQTINVAGGANMY